MVLDDHTPVPQPETSQPASGAYTITLNEDERQVLVLALGELLQSTERGEHLIPTIRSLLDHLQPTQTGA